MKGHDYNMKPFLDKKSKIGVVGASNIEGKFGFKVFKDLKRAEFNVAPINSKYDEVQDVKCFSSIESAPKLDAIIIITTPESTKDIIEEAKKKKIKNIWLQPGAESEFLLEKYSGSDINLVHHRCVMVERRLNKHNPYGEIAEELEKYDEGTPNKSTKDAVCD